MTARLAARRRSLSLARSAAVIGLAGLKLREIGPANMGGRGHSPRAPAYRSADLGKSFSWYSLAAD